MKSRRTILTIIVLASLVSLGVGPATAQSPDPVRVIPAPVSKVLGFDQAGAKPSKHYRIAYLAECVPENAYCQTRLKGLNAAAKKYGFTFKIFDAAFNPATQVKQVQTAVAQNFDGYLFAPAASASGCSMWKQYLVPTHKPVVSLDIPMCGSTNYTKGLAATVTMQSQKYFTLHVENAFKSCKTTCQVAAIGGFTGSDLFTYWENAIKTAQKRYPKANVVVNQPGNFDPRVGLKVIQDALRAHPKISVVISSWDAMTVGALQAIKSAGKKPGSDVRIYTIGGTKDAVSKVKAGTYNETTILAPYEEAYYGGVSLVMALEGKAPNGYVNEAYLPLVTTGPGTLLITKSDVPLFRPNY